MNGNRKDIPPQPNPLSKPDCRSPAAKKPVDTALDALYLKLADAVLTGRDEEQNRLAGIIALCKGR